MERHTVYGLLSPILEKYPHTSGPFFQTYNDLALAQKWQDIEILDISSISRGGFKGRQPSSDDLSIIVPCTLSESLSMKWISSIFLACLDTKAFFLAIAAEDSSVVYYRISKGIIKPPM